MFAFAPSPRDPYVRSGARRAPDHTNCGRGCARCLPRGRSGNYGSGYLSGEDEKEPCRFGFGFYPASNDNVVSTRGAEGVTEPQETQQSLVDGLVAEFARLQHASDLSVSVPPQTVTVCLRMAHATAQKESKFGSAEFATLGVDSERVDTLHTRPPRRRPHQCFVMRSSSLRSVPEGDFK